MLLTKPLLAACQNGHLEIARLVLTVKPALVDMNDKGQGGKDNMSPQEIDHITMSALVDTDGGGSYFFSLIYFLPLFISSHQTQSFII